MSVHHQMHLFPLARSRTMVERRTALARALVMDSPDLHQALEVILEIWMADVSSGDMSDQTFGRYEPLADRFAKFADRHGCKSLDDALNVYPTWLNARGRDRSGASCPPSLSTRHLRSCAVRALYATARTLGWTTAHPSYVTREENATTRQGRPLLEGEFDTIRAIASAKRHTRHAAAIAIALSGGGTADIASMTPAHIDLADGTITLPGGRHIAERTVRIPGQWEYDILKERLADLRKFGHTADDGLVVRRQGSAASRQAGAAIALTKVLQEGQLRSDSEVKPASIARWAALVAFETNGDISTAAALLGTGSLDTAAAAIRWDWTNGPAVKKDPRPDYRPGVIA